jgi:DNA-binding IclR family transcriptional regulator
MTATMTAGLTAPDTGEGPGEDLGTSVGKALALLRAFDSGAPTLGVSELARRAQLPKSTAFRLLRTLEQNGFVERRGVRYAVGRSVFELGNLTWYCRPRSLRDVALPYMVELLESTHQTVHLALLDGADVLYVEKLYHHLHVTSPSYVGGRVPAQFAAIGKAMLAASDEQALESVPAEPWIRRTRHSAVDRSMLLAEIDRIRDEGVAFDNEEVKLGLTCVGAAITRSDGTVAGLSIAGPTGRFEPELVVSSLRRVAAAISGQLG